MAELYNLKPTWKMCFAVLTVSAFCAWTIPATAQTPNEIKWDDTVTFSRTSVDDDVKDVLRGILRANGLSVLFRDGVKGSVSFYFNEMKLASAFNLIMEQYGFSHTYNPDTKTVMVYAFGQENEGRGVTRKFVPLNHTDYEPVRRALRSFGLGERGVVYDAATRTVSIIGTPKRISDIEGLISTLETRAAEAQKFDLEAERRKVATQRAKAEQRVYADLANARIKIIPLRYADVGPTTKQFHGKSVTIPGIAQTLETILGIPSGPPSTASVPNGLQLPGLEQSKQAIPYVPAGPRKISIDQRTNSVIVRGSIDEIDAIEKIVQELDQPLWMIEIEVLIANAEIGIAEELGIRWRGSQTGSNGDPKSGAVDTGTSGGQVGGGAPLFSTDGLDAISLLPLAGIPGATVASFVARGSDGFIQMQLRALAEQNRARILSSPSLVTLENSTARITRSQDIFVQVDGGSENGVALDEIQTGLSLEITPSVILPDETSSDALIRLSINATNSTPGSGVFGEIDVISQEVQTNVLIPEGTTFVIGGLFDDTRRERNDGVPGLKEVPLLGKLFQSKTATNTLGETIFLITPRLVDERVVAKRDIATSVGSQEYIDRQKALLAATSATMERANVGSPLQDLEEDE